MNIFLEKKVMDTSLIPRYTYADYEQWKEDWELIKGHPYQFLPSARRQHNRVQVKLSLWQNNSLSINIAIVLYLLNSIGK